jgi:uncharacterized Zn-binding protein involved in type VI secretion
MLKSIGIDGCTTSHGGVVNATQTTKTNHGIPMLQAGDGFQCPICKMWSTLLSGSSTLSFNGVKASLEGDLFTCGAVLIAKQNTAKATMKSDDGAINNISKLLSGLKDGTTAYTGQFQLVNELDGTPHANTKYKIKYDDGTVVEGITSDVGLTEILPVKDKPSKVTIELGEIEGW